MIGNHLLKRIHFLEDTQGRDIELKYLKKKFPQINSYQLTYNAKKNFVSQENIRVCDAFKILPELLSKL